MNGFIECTQDAMVDVRRHRIDAKTLKVIKDKAEQRATAVKQRVEASAKAIEDAKEALKRAMEENSKKKPSKRLRLLK